MSNIMFSAIMIAYFHIVSRIRSSGTQEVKNLPMRTLFFLFIVLLHPGQSAIDAQQLSSSMTHVDIRREIPVLCFHHIRKEAPRPNELSISADAFRADMKMLYDSGFHSISPAQLLDYYSSGKPLPPKPFMLTFDDGNTDQWENSIEVLDEYNFKALFFIMTVTVGKKNYLTEEQIRLLSQWEHYIGCHTWDHQSVNSLKSK